QTDSAAADTTEVSPWEHGASLAITLSSINVNNWAAGGQSALSGNSEFIAFANYTTDNQTWNNRLQIGYGVLQEGGFGETIKKNNDVFIFTSRYGRTINKNLKISAGIDFRSQVAQGFDYATDSVGIERATLTSNILAPGYLINSLGVAYHKGNFSADLAPLTGKYTFVLDQGLADQGLYGVEAGQRVRAEFGYSAAIAYKKAFSEDFEYQINALLFSNYEGLDKVDVNVEFQARYRLNKWLTANFSSQIIYDEDIDITRTDGTVGPAIQFRSVTNFGFGFEFWK
ncbi:MAG TPA: hypothetical protein DCE41_15675, partial [Cytophagales bacterium]|nr:hypothetical protein [Cytophagales bacterium]